VGFLTTSESDTRSPPNASTAAIPANPATVLPQYYPGLAHGRSAKYEIPTPDILTDYAVPGESYLVHGHVKAKISNISALAEQRATEFRNEQSYHLELKSIKRTHPPEDVLMQFPRDVPGCALRSRKWRMDALRRNPPNVQPSDSLTSRSLADYFYLDKMTAPYNEVGPGEDEFAQLATPKEHKQLILALVRSHSRGKLATPGRAVDIRAEMDLVRGKGKGLIILLHGVPGVGKTSTAESIASFTKRPLYLSHAATSARPQRRSRRVPKPTSPWRTGGGVSCCWTRLMYS
jgi:hypothetical protein